MENNPEKTESESKAPRKLDGVVVGALIGMDPDGAPLVAFPGNAETTALTARSTVPLSGEDTGARVALLFEEGDPARPIVIGRIQEFSDDKNQRVDIQASTDEPMFASVDGERLEFEAKREIVLRCGKSSITLTRAGKIILRGAYVLSRSSGVNRIKGGSVQIN